MFSYFNHSVFLFPGPASLGEPVAHLLFEICWLTAVFYFKETQWESFFSSRKSLKTFILIANASNFRNL